jgi:polyribonucleotide nucleotidyltransferase
VAKISKSFQYGNQTVTLETGEIARQAGGAVMVSCDGTVVLCTAVAAKTAARRAGLLPADGGLPGEVLRRRPHPGWLLQARRPRDREGNADLSRLIDRPIRPLFPDGFRNEVQVIATVMSLNPEVDGDIPALIGCSAAVALTGAPFDGPIGAAKVGYRNGQYLLNPTVSELKESQLELVVAGTKDAVLMVESEAAELSEDVMLGAVVFGHQQMQVAIDTINALVAEAGKPKWTWAAPAARTRAWSTR